MNPGASHRTFNCQRDILLEDRAGLRRGRRLKRTGGQGPFAKAPEARVTSGTRQ